VTLIDIQLDTDTEPATPVQRPRLRTLLSAPATTGAILALALALGAAVYLATRPPAPARVHSVQVGVSAYPATVTALWYDQDGAAHTLDPWLTTPQTLAARAVVIAVAGDDVQCTLAVDGRTVDTAVAQPGTVAVCAWTGTVSR
jgi:hypothetical protein